MAIVKDFGVSDKESADYPEIAQAVTAQVTDKSYNSGILICGTGIGMSIAANKVTGIRAALCRTSEDVVAARSHNDANVLCLGAEAVSKLSDNQLEQLVVSWLLTQASNEQRHIRRVLSIE
jgi:ribose 5-phosphate isomerase B